ncbi:hypothetical protein [Bradyrhizobium sp. LB13.1]
MRFGKLLIRYGVGGLCFFRETRKLLFNPMQFPAEVQTVTTR